MASIDLSTTYLGLQLANPFMTGASPLADHLDTVRRLEDAGCAAIVLHSLFEEQISQAASGRIRHLDPLDRQFATVLSYFPEPEEYALGPDQYLEHLRQVKAAVTIPVIASLNGTTAEAWLRFATQLEQAGADALELNMYEVVTDADQSSLAIEHDSTRSCSSSRRAEDSDRRQALAVLHGIRPCRSRAGSVGRERSGPVQPVHPAGHRYP
jgi:dihydroorotate dehydrogenase (fumarate)